MMAAQHEDDKSADLLLRGDLDQAAHVDSVDN